MTTPPRGREALLRLGVLSALTMVGLGACRRDDALGLPDSFAVYAPVRDANGAWMRSRGGLDVVEPVPPDDPRAAPLWKQFAAGFPAEVLRTDYLAKQLVREAEVGGQRYGDDVRAAAGEPTVFVLGAPSSPLVRRGVAIKKSFGRTDDHPNVVWMGLPDYPEHDRALPQSLAGLIGTAAAARVSGWSGQGDPTTSALVRGYAQALEVIAREWRVGEGPTGTIPSDAGTTVQRALFAGVRENHYAVGANGTPRPAADLLADPGLVATVLYRLAQSKAVGRKVAPAEVYAPFVKDRVPPGVSPAAVLGPFRNFQAKLLSAWGRAVLEGSSPRDVAELVAAYGRALPAENLEVTRVFVITTYGATVKAGGVPTSADKPAAALAELTALAAEVAAGKLSPRAAAGP